jgi:hypothetical protein
VQYLVEDAGANMGDVDDVGKAAWDLLIEHLDYVADDGHLDDGREYDDAALTPLMRFLVLHGAPPPALVAHLSPAPALVVQEGARLRARLRACLVRRRALLDAHCPVLLPPLQALVHGYMERTTTEELWATGLGAAS